MKTQRSVVVGVLMAFTLAAAGCGTPEADGSAASEPTPTIPVDELSDAGDDNDGSAGDELSDDDTTAVDELAPDADGMAERNFAQVSPERGSATFVADDAAFKAVFPARPDRDEQPFIVFDHELTLVNYIVELDLGGGAIAVGSIDFATIERDPTYRGYSLDDGLAGVAGSVGGVVVSQSPDEVLFGAGVDGVIEAPGLTDHVRIIVVGSRVWILQALVKPGEEAPPEYQTLLDSFTII